MSTSPSLGKVSRLSWDLVSWLSTHCSGSRCHYAWVDSLYIAALPQSCVWLGEYVHSLPTPSDGSYGKRLPSPCSLDPGRFSCPHRCSDSLFVEGSSYSFMTPRSWSTGHRYDVVDDEVSTGLCRRGVPRCVFLCRLGGDEWFAVRSAR